MKPAVFVHISRNSGRGSNPLHGQDSQERSSKYHADAAAFSRELALRDLKFGSEWPTFANTIKRKVPAALLRQALCSSRNAGD